MLLSSTAFARHPVVDLLRNSVAEVFGALSLIRRDGSRQDSARAPVFRRCGARARGEVKRMHIGSEL
jgi:hypothetical protein